MKAVTCHPKLVRDLFVRETRNPSSLGSMLNCNPTNVALSIYIEKGVFIKVSRLDHSNRTKLYIKRISVLKILDFHGVNDRSKNALCTVSPSGNSTTLRYLPPMSGIDAQRRIRPSC